MKFTESDIEAVLKDNGWSQTSRNTLFAQLKDERANRKRKEKNAKYGLPISLSSLAQYYFSSVGQEAAEFDISINGKRMTISHVRLEAGASNALNGHYAVVSDGRVEFYNNAVEVRQFGGRTK